jgi:hypothetical protein
MASPISQRNSEQQTSLVALHTSAFDPKRTSLFAPHSDNEDRSVSMLRCLIGAIVLLVTLSLAQGAPSALVHKKRHVTKHWHGYGFLPGYRPPEVIERDRAAHYYRVYGPRYYGPAWPGFYRGRWNGGGFGPCWTQTPIGSMWNCGR